jgi:hypothetical protein
MEGGGNEAEGPKTEGPKLSILGNLVWFALGGLSRHDQHSGRHRMVAQPDQS